MFMEETCIEVCNTILVILTWCVPFVRFCCNTSVKCCTKLCFNSFFNTISSVKCGKTCSEDTARKLAAVLGPEIMEKED